MGARRCLGWGENGVMRYSWRRSLQCLNGSTSGTSDSLDDKPDASAAVRLDELRDVPVVVMLGERGAGKSVTLDQ